jgi:hypothetical protein
MPAIADPFASHPHDLAPDTARRQRSAVEAPSVRVRLRTAVQRTALTRALAHGALETGSPELALRAQQLTSERHRRSVARAMRRTIAEAYRPPLARARLTLIRRSAVLEAEEAINAMIDRVNGSLPVRTEGMAMAELILNNAEQSPLYNSTGPGTLLRQIRLATAAMDDVPESSRSHEFALTA